MQKKKKMTQFLFFVILLHIYFGPGSKTDLSYVLSFTINQKKYFFEEYKKVIS